MPRRPGSFDPHCGKTMGKLPVPERKRGSRRRLWEKMLSSLPNSHAAENDRCSAVMQNK
jgi:hypothetical protein